MYTDRPWCYSKAVWAVGVWVIFAMVTAYECKPNNYGTPLFVGLTGFHIVWAYKVVLETRKSLISLNCILDTHFAAFLSGNQFVKQISVL